MKEIQFKPKYEMLEVVEEIDNETYALAGLVKYELIKDGLLNYEILSVRDFDATKTTSIIIKKTIIH